MRSSRRTSGSLRRSRASDTHSPTMTTMNGSAAMIVRFCSPVRASFWPTTSMTAATAPVSTPQNTTTRLVGSIEPLWESVPMTIEAASAPDTKKMATSTITTTPATAASGKWSSSPNSWASWLAWPARSVPPRCTSMAVPPRMANQIRLTTLGTTMTPPTNWRMVRPRLIRAMNIPTNGVHEIHQAQ